MNKRDLEIAELKREIDSWMALTDRAQDTSIKLKLRMQSAANELEELSRGDNQIQRFRALQISERLRGEEE